MRQPKIIAAHVWGARPAKHTVKKAQALLVQICKVEKKDPERAMQRFRNGLVGMAPEFKELV